MSNQLTMNALWNESLLAPIPTEIFPKPMRIKRIISKYFNEMFSNLAYAINSHNDRNAYSHALLYGEEGIDEWYEDLIDYKEHLSYVCYIEPKEKEQLIDRLCELEVCYTKDEIIRELIRRSPNQWLEN